MRLCPILYVDHNRHVDFIATFSDTLNIVEDGEDMASLDTVIRRQYRNAEYGSELLLAYWKNRTQTELDL